MCLNTILFSMTLGFMNGQQDALPLAESDSQSGRITCNRGGSGWMDESDIFRGQGLVCVRLEVCVCVCVCECHTLTYLVYCRHLYIAVGNAGRQSARLKLAVRATCLVLTKAETPEQTGQRWREQEGRRVGGERGDEEEGEGIDHPAGLTPSLVRVLSFFSPFCDTGRHC